MLHASIIKRKMFEFARVASRILCGLGLRVHNEHARLRTERSSEPSSCRHLNPPPSPVFYCRMKGREALTLVSSLALCVFLSRDVDLSGFPIPGGCWLWHTQHGPAPSYLHLHFRAKSFTIHGAPDQAKTQGTQRIELVANWNVHTACKCCSRSKIYKQILHAFASWVNLGLGSVPAWPGQCK